MARSPEPDDDQPWLAEGVREERSTLVPRARLFGGALVAVLLAVLVAIGVYLVSGHKSDGSGGYARPEDAPLIGADAGAYKVAPANPGGAQITGIDDSVAAVAGGRDQGSTVLPDEPEEPVARPAAGVPGAAPPGGVPATAPPTDLLPPAARLPAGPTPAPTASAPAAALPTRPIAAAPVVAPPAVVPKSPKSDAPKVGAPPSDAAKATRAEPPAAKPKPVQPAPDPLAAPPVKATRPPDAARVADASARSPDTPARAAGGSVTLQLGAFSTREKADAAWTTAGGDGALSGLAKRIEPVDRDGTTLYRLRAGGVASRDAAKALCGRIRAAGNACIVAE